MTTSNSPARQRSTVSVSFRRRSTLWFPISLLFGAAALAIMPSPWWPFVWQDVPAAAADKTYGSVTVTEVVAIYDGDTFTVNIADWPPIIGERVKVRIAGIDCPEMRDDRPEVKALARQAKQFTVARLRAAQTVELRDMRRDKYFRILADVYCDGESLGEMLLAAGHAKVYEGGKRPQWP